MSVMKPCAPVNWCSRLSGWLYKRSLFWLSWKIADLYFFWLSFRNGRERQIRGGW